MPPDPVLDPPKPDAAAPSPAPVRTTETPPAPAGTPIDRTIDGGFDAIDAAFSKANAATEPTKKPDAAPPKPEVVAKPSAAATAASPEPKPEPPANPASATPEAVRTPKELRAEKERLSGELETLRKSHSSLEAKIKDYESKGKDVEVLTKRLEEREKQLAVKDGELRALKRETTPEFKKQYDEPFDQAAEWAKDYVNRLSHNDGTKANFEQDFIPLYRMVRDTGTVGQAKAKAIELFGDMEADEVMSSVKDLVRLDRIKERALQDVKANWQKQEEEAQANSVLERGKKETQAKENAALWTKVVTELQTNVADYRDPADDKESAEWRKKGYDWLDAPIKPDEEGRIRFAHARHMAAAFWPLKLANKRKEAKIAELEKRVADLTAAKRPGGGGGSNPTGGEAPASEADWNAGLKKAMENA